MDYIIHSCSEEHTLIEFKLMNYTVMYRNYYKCSVEGCPVKKRVERDTEDPRYVLTTYHGIHNHRDLLSYDFETNLRN